MQKFVSTSALAAVLALSVTGGAAATPLTGVFNVTVYNFEDPNYKNHGHPGSSTDPSEQALPGAQPAGAASTTFTYTGALNFALAEGATNTIAAFIKSGGGTSTGSGAVYNSMLSSGDFDVTSLFKFSFTTASALTGTITHDDGISLFRSGNTTTDLLPISASAPTAVSTTSYTIAAGSYDLYYTEANGLPAQLNFNVVPEPATLALLGTGLIGLGLVGRRRQGGASSL